MPLAAIGSPSDLSNVIKLRIERYKTRYKSISRSANKYPTEHISAETSK